MIKLSIIVPIYNVEPYLRKCVASLLDQNLARDEYEIILVDDGSTDKSSEICDECECMFDNIRVIHQKNGGLSAARNNGIKIARGEYIMFVDSDDYLQKNVFGGLMAQIERDDLDVLRYNYQNVREDGSIFEPFKNVKPYFDYSSEVVDGETFLNERLGYACYACQFLIKRALLEECIFTQGIYFEDTDWTPRMLLKAKRVASTELMVYNYLWRTGSITLPTDPVKKKKVLDDKMRQISGFLEQKKLVKNQSWFMWKISEAAIGVLTSVSVYPKIERNAYIRGLKSLNIFPLSTYRAVGNNKYKIWLANLSPAIYCWMMKVSHRRKV